MTTPSIDDTNTIHVKNGFFIVIDDFWFYANAPTKYILERKYSKFGWRKSFQFSRLYIAQQKSRKKKKKLQLLCI